MKSYLGHLQLDTKGPRKRNRPDADISNNNSIPVQHPACDEAPPAPTATCVDTGTDYSTFVPLDYDGNPRPAGAGYDIGPFEQ